MSDLVLKIEELRNEIENNSKYIIKETVKNGVTKIGIMENNDNKIKPVMYLEDLIIANPNLTLNDITEKFSNLSYQDTEINTFVDEILDEEFVKENIYLCLEQEENNEDDLTKEIKSLLIPMDYSLLNLVPVLRILIHKENTCNMSVKLTRNLLSNLSIDLTELLWCGMENQFKIGTAKTMGEIMGLNDIPGMDEMYVLSNTYNLNGAAQMLNEELLKEIMKKTNSTSLIILPSSIHELIVYPDRTDKSEKEYDDFKAMVKEVNDTQVEPTDRLSYNIYTYDEYGYTTY